ncbi:MAG: sugar ABC transporter substrate-binding protein [Candidatus Limiplasma sp.]|nr:sugar ABC transporter substrate-binding protein [Candidatus Limiplasma sp.]
MKKRISLLLALLIAMSCVSIPALAGDEITLNFLIMPDLEILQPTFDLYEEQNPGVKINVEVLPFDKMFEAIEVRLGNGEDSIDALLVDCTVVANYALKGYLAELEDKIAPESPGNLTEAALDSVTYNDHIYALPLYSSCVQLYYNKDLFDAKQVPYPAADPQSRMTWEQVVELAKQLTYTDDGGKQIYGLIFEQVNRPYQLLPLAQSLGATQFVSEDGLTTTGYTNSPEMVKAGQFYADTFNTWKISPKVGADESTNLFTSGQVAMFVGGSWQIPAMLSANLNFGYAAHPYFEGGVPVTPTGSWCAGVSAYSKNQEEAAKFVEFLTCNNDTAIQNFKIIKNLPSNIAALESIDADPAYETFPDDVARLSAYESLNTAMSRPKMAGYTEWQDIVQKAFSDMMNGADPQGALDAAVAEIDQQLQKYAE